MTTAATLTLTLPLVYLTLGSYLARVAMRRAEGRRAVVWWERARG